MFLPLSLKAELGNWDIVNIKETLWFTELYHYEATFMILPNLTRYNSISTFTAAFQWLDKPWMEYRLKWSWNQCSVHFEFCFKESINWKCYWSHSQWIVTYCERISQLWFSYWNNQELVEYLTSWLPMSYKSYFDDKYLKTYTCEAVPRCLSVQLASSLVP
jgi:hypothetical protein